MTGDWYVVGNKICGQALTVVILGTSLTALARDTIESSLLTRTQVMRGLWQALIAENHGIVQTDEIGGRGAGHAFFCLKVKERTDWALTLRQIGAVQGARSSQEDTGSAHCHQGSKSRACTLDMTEQSYGMQLAIGTTWCWRRGSIGTAPNRRC